MPLTEATAVRQIKAYAKKHRIAGDYAVARSVTSAAAVVNATMAAAADKWRPFAFGQADRLYEGSIRRFRTIWNSVIAEHPAALLLELEETQKQIADRDKTIGDPEQDVKRLRALASRDVEVKELSQLCDQIDPLRKRIKQLTDEKNRLDWRLSDKEVEDECGDEYD